MIRKKTAVVTGGSSGIGAEICKALYHENYSVYCMDKKVPPTEVNQCLESFVRIDLATFYDIEEVVEGYPHDHLTLLVNNAAIAEARPILDISITSFQDILSVNLIAPWLMMKSFHSRLKEGEGSIVNISSVSGLQGYSGHAHYCASKFGLQGLMQVAAKEFARDGIRVNNVCPGPTKTEMWDKLDREYSEMNDWPDEMKEEDKYHSRLLVKRMGLPEDVANAVVFLASPKAEYITGTSLKVCGGNLLG